MPRFSISHLPALLVGITLSLSSLYTLYDPLLILRLTDFSHTVLSSLSTDSANFFTQAAGRQAVVGLTLLILWYLGDYRAMNLLLGVWGAVVVFVDAVVSLKAGTTYKFADAFVATLIMGITQVGWAYRLISSA